MGIVKRPTIGYDPYSNKTKSTKPTTSKTAQPTIKNTATKKAEPKKEEAVVEKIIDEPEVINVKEVIDVKNKVSETAVDTAINKETVDTAININKETSESKKEVKKPRYGGSFIDKVKNSKKNIDNSNEVKSDIESKEEPKDKTINIGGSLFTFEEL